jgi:hypothetical protein
VNEWEAAPVNTTPDHPILEQRIGHDLQLCALRDADRVAVHVIAFDLDANPLGRIATVREDGAAAAIWPHAIESAKQLYARHLVARCSCGHRVDEHGSAMGCRRVSCACLRDAEEAA